MGMLTKATVHGCKRKCKKQIKVVAKAVKPAKPMPI